MRVYLLLRYPSYPTEGQFDLKFQLNRFRDLSRNKLANIIEDKMNRVSLPHIRRLNFASNNLKVIPTDAFTLFPSLESLDLQHNPISSILEGSFTGIKTLYINTESLYCDCTLKPFVEWLNVNDMVDVQVKCQNPFKLRGQSLLEVPVEDLICGKHFNRLNIPTDSLRDRIAFSSSY